METLKLLNRYKSFGGWVEFYSHPSTSTRTEMKFSVYRPPQAETGPVPILYWLSGLCCTEENFMIKAGAQPHAAKHGLMIVCPDTSPRGAGIEGEDKDWDFGTGAGFYVNATTSKWKSNYRMYDYVTVELPHLIHQHFPVRADRESIFGHSMGGHGALIAALKQPGRYRSASAFAPISAPSLCPWGEKAFGEYLGHNRTDWEEYDTCALIRKAETRLPFLVDQGTSDSFLEVQLKPDLLKKACAEKDYPLDLRIREGYDHGYYFIASFVAEHIEYHARELK